jgi:hypothetical protein
MAMPYKPSLQAWFIVDKMSQAERSIQEVLSRLMTQLESIERKVDCNIADLEKVREKVDLAMTSLSGLHEEHVSVMKQLQTVAGARTTSTGDGILGPAPSVAASSSVGMNNPTSTTPTAF